MKKYITLNIFDKYIKLVLQCKTAKKCVFMFLKPHQLKTFPTNPFLTLFYILKKEGYFWKNVQLWYMQLSLWALDLFPAWPEPYSERKHKEKFFIKGWISIQTDWKPKLPRPTSMKIVFLVLITYSFFS